jgi:hypothetical protein
MREPSTSSAWGVLAGFVGSLCCIGPSAAVFLGLGSSSALAGLTLDRNWALAGGLALLALGLAVALRSARACQLRGVARWRQPALMLAAFVCSYALIGLLLPNVAARQVEASEAPEAVLVPVAAPAAKPVLRRASILIEKMICPPCASHVHNALKRDPNVREFVAEEGNEVVVIVYDSNTTSAQKQVRRFPGSYEATLMSDEALP